MDVGDRFEVRLEDGTWRPAQIRAIEACLPSLGPARKGYRTIRFVRFSIDGIVERRGLPERAFLQRARPIQEPIF